MLNRNASKQNIDISKNVKPPWPKVRRLASGELQLHDGNKQTVVYAKPCFPWSQPSAYISLRDEKGKELFFIECLKKVDAEISLAVSQALALANFVLPVEQVLEVEEELELRAWQVKLATGEERKFQTKLDDWPLNTPNGGLLLKDVFGDLYLIADVSRLNATSRKHLWAFLD